jgi:signal transduction histidine kinase
MTDHAHPSTFLLRSDAGRSPTLLSDDDRWRYLAGIDIALGAAFDEDAVVATALRLLVPVLADVAVLWLLRDGNAMPVRIAHARDELMPLLERARSEERMNVAHPLARVLRTGEAEWTPVHASLLHAIARDAEHLARLTAIAPTTMLVLPLASQGMIVGGLTLCTVRGSARRYAPADLVLARDVSARIARALAHARRHDRARETLRSHATRLAGTAHDLKDPLATIELALAFALEPNARGEAPPLDEVTHRTLAAARRAAQRMRRLVHDTLDAAAAEARVRSEPPLSAARLLGDLAAEYRSQASARAVTIVVDVVHSLPRLHGDRDHLMRAVGNLLGNAIRFTPAGGYVTLTAAPCDDGVELSVRDTGPGVVAAHRSHIFERFWRYGASAGAGLGLAIVREFVEGVGGTVGCDPFDGGGARFWMRLPIATTAP